MSFSLDSQQQRLEQLSTPPPQSFILKTVIQLLHSTTTQCKAVYLLEKPYLQNWLQWAIEQKVIGTEIDRARQGIRYAALQYGLVPPVETAESSSNQFDPSPINSMGLSVPGYPLLLNPLAETAVTTEQLNTSSLSSFPPLSKVLSTPNNGGSKANIFVDNEEDYLVQPVECIAVPEAFYELLRSVHGVLCDDEYTISFQPAQSEPLLLQHHVHETTIQIGDSDKKNGNNEYNSNNDSPEAPTNEYDDTPLPIEFRRKVIRQPYRPMLVSEPKTPMDKLLMEEQMLQEPKLVPVIETHPVKLFYQHFKESNGSSDNNGATTNGSTNGYHNSSDDESGFVLVSRATLLIDALPAVMRVAEPRKASECIRTWYAVPSPASNATQVGDNTHELVNLNEADHDRWTVGEWVNQIYGNGVKEALPVNCHYEVTLFFETRRTVNTPWPRDDLILSHRIQVGDFCDAQDVAGQWYEAVVREVTPETVTVHYAGWASRWDAQIKRDFNSVITDKQINRKVQAPAPLWSRSRKWRERIQVGDMVEVRDSSSLTHRPKWYKGEVKKIGRVVDEPRDLTGGADVEMYSVLGTDKKAPLLLLHRTQQILVQVEQEQMDKARAFSPGEGDLAAGLNPDPPFLRWVNLYGEEICEFGTHMSKSDMNSPVTLKYDVDSHRKPVEVMKSHMGAGFMRESLRGNPPAPGSVGLQNLGNSCFLNSTVQCLNHIEPLTQFFLHDAYMKDLNTRNPLSSGGNVALAYASLVKKMWGGDYSILAPRMLKKTVAAFAPQFDNSYQHDCQEFCQFLMDGLHEDLNRVESKPYVEELEGFGMDDDVAAIESWRKHLLRHDSIIVDHCQGMHRSHLTCPKCGRESIKFDVYSSISLPLATFKNKTTIKLEDCLEKFMEGEQLDERNAWYCPTCRQHVCALKMIALWTVPDVLILHLKRFTFDTCMTSGGMLRAKIDHKVEFPVEGLDLSRFILGPKDPDNLPVYRLFGVSEHTGPTANSGHYTATVRNSIDDRWYRYNDSQVGLTSGEASITGGAYLLFYQRTKGISKWGGMYKAMQQREVDPYGGLERDHEGFTKVKAKAKKKK